MRWKSLALQSRRWQARGLVVRPLNLNSPTLTTTPKKHLRPRHTHTSSPPPSLSPPTSFLAGRSLPYVHRLPPQQSFYPPPAELRGGRAEVLFLLGLHLGVITLLCLFCHCYCCCSDSLSLLLPLGNDAVSE